MSLAMRLRFAAIVTPLAYLLVTALIYLWLPLMQGWEMWRITLLIVPQMVLGMVFLVTPTAQHLLRRIS